MNLFHVKLGPRQVVLQSSDLELGREHDGQGHLLDLQICLVSLHEHRADSVSQELLDIIYLDPGPVLRRTRFRSADQL